MVQTRVKKDVKFKTGIVFNAGDAIDVYTYENEDGQKFPWRATVANRTNGQTVFMKMTALHNLSDEFIQVTDDGIEAAMCDDGTCDSMTGQTVEPDGYDTYGFPSMLMALGLC